MTFTITQFLDSGKQKPSTNTQRTQELGLQSYYDHTMSSTATATPSPCRTAHPISLLSMAPSIQLAASTRRRMDAASAPLPWAMPGQPLSPASSRKQLVQAIDEALALIDEDLISDDFAMPHQARTSSWRSEQ